MIFKYIYIKPNLCIYKTMIFYVFTLGTNGLCIEGQLIFNFIVIVYRTILLSEKYLCSVTLIQVLVYRVSCIDDTKKMYRAEHWVLK